MCKHNKNFAIDEVMTAYHTRLAVDGRPDELNEFGQPVGYNEMGDIKYYIFRCMDCGKEKRFPYLGAGPVFVKNAVEILFP